MNDPTVNIQTFGNGEIKTEYASVPLSCFSPNEIVLLFTLLRQQNKNINKQELLYQYEMEIKSTVKEEHFHTIMESLTYKLKNFLDIQLSDIFYSQPSSYKTNKKQSINADFVQFDEICKQLGNTPKSKIAEQHTTIDSLITLYHGSFYLPETKEEWFLEQRINYQVAYLEWVGKYFGILWEECKYTQIVSLYKTVSKILHPCHEMMIYHFMALQALNMNANILQEYLQTNLQAQYKIIGQETAHTAIVLEIESIVSKSS